MSFTASDPETTSKDEGQVNGPIDESDDSGSSFEELNH